METLFAELVFWHWFALGLLLLIGEIFGFGGYLLWPGIAAVVTGTALLLVPGMPWELQALLFAIGSVVSVVLWRRYLKRHPSIVDEPHLNQRTASYVGRVLVLSEPLQNGRGKLRVDDSNWDVTGPDLPAGTRVRVVGSTDMILQVEAED